MISLFGISRIQAQMWTYKLINNTGESIQVTTDFGVPSGNCGEAENVSLRHGESKIFNTPMFCCPKNITATGQTGAIKGVKTEHFTSDSLNERCKSFTFQFNKTAEIGINEQ